MITDSVREFETERPRLFGLAYRMLGSAQEAEDVVQEAYLRWAGTDRAAVRTPAAWLTTTVTRLCLTVLDSARARRERYVGPWLPEPVLTSGGALGPMESSEQREEVSSALLLLLERLSPPERAVYVLRHAFGYGHREIAGMLGLSEPGARQHLRRARARLAEERARYAVESERQRALVETFLAASRAGDVRELVSLLAEEVSWWSDGGGRVSAARKIVVGRERVTGLLRKALEKGLVGAEFRPAEINGEAALVIFADGRLAGVVQISGGAEGITQIRAVLNPEKLTYLAGQLGAEGVG
ncbi:RNA polymerase sigma-70 factor [Streptomyces sp. NRRL F-5630]|uniref:RNA polymerase sigma-70 factor n=1 Tax=unclassified Streptomyces TaxID=2593676 RepID=UPI0004C653C5